MNVLDFSILPGWPGSTETWQFLQNMILQAQNASLLGGKNFIISGCIESAGNATDGIICVDGEILPFVGGPVQPKVIVADTPVGREFFGGAVNPYYHNRVATFGSGTGEVLWTDFKRNNPDNGVLARLDKMEKMLTPLMGYDDPANPGTTVYGSWLFWGRIAAEIPAGWEAVPDADWKGKVPVVMDSTDVDFDTVGKVGGEKKHQLTIAEMPSHTHTQTGVVAANSGTSGIGANNGTSNTGSTGNDAPHNNLQPYKVVMFIRFVG